MSDPEHFAACAGADTRVRLLRVITRMNVGGATVHVAVLANGMSPERYDQTLALGSLGPDEGSLEHLISEQGGKVRRIAGLRPQLRPWDDLRALVGLVRLIREHNPDIVETHTAKAGVVGRLAAVLARRPRPAIVHYYHGHVLIGYFSLPVTLAYRIVERGLARVSDRLVSVSEATKDELVGLGVAGEERFEVVRLGLDLDPFVQPESTRVERARRELGGAGDETVLACFVGRLVPIKRVDLLLEALAEVRRRVPALRLALVGDGPLREELEVQARRLGVDDIVCFAGFRHDMPAVVGAMDIGVLPSDNEGSPISLIGAAAGGRCVLATRVGGVPEVVTPESGRLVPPGDARAIASALSELATDADLRLRLGAAGRRRALDRWAFPRLLEEMDRLYDSVLEERRGVA